MPKYLSREECAIHDKANAELGCRFVRALAVEKATLDPARQFAEVKVLAAISYFMNTTKQRSWPSYAQIAEVTGYGEISIKRAIASLESAGYIFRERRAISAGSRAVVQYGLKAFSPTDIDDMVTAAVNEFRRAHEKSDRIIHCPVSDELTVSSTVRSGSEGTFPRTSEGTKFCRQEPLSKNPREVLSEVKGVAHAREPAPEPAKVVEAIEIEVPTKRRADRGERFDETKHVEPNQFAWRQAALDAGLSETAYRNVYLNFRDYWTARAGAGAIKLDWLATWRLWCRRDADGVSNRAPSRGHGFNPEAI